VANAIRKAKSADTEKLVEALKGLQMLTPFGPVTWRAIDHQSTMGAYVGQLAKKDGKGTMVNWRYADGAKYQPSDQEIRALRKE
jgi:branched-chain amino acid transport system substrate-binding protein